MLSRIPAEIPYIGPENALCVSEGAALSDPFYGVSGAVSPVGQH
jgi:hypothetical protein